MLWYILDMTRHTPLILLTALAVTASFWAFTQADGEVIQACASKNGLLHLIGAGFNADACKSNETPVSWSEQGIQGEKGDTGEQGEQGENGEAGENGADGTDGNDGEDGTTLHLFDDDGQDLGILLDAHGSSDVSFRTYLEPISALMNSAQRIDSMTAVINSVTKSIQYTNSDCTGDAVTTGKVAPQVLYFDDADDFGLGHIMATGEPPALRTIKSRREASGNCKDLGSQTLLTNTLEQVTLPFTEPLAYPLEIRGL